MRIVLLSCGECNKGEYDSIEADIDSKEGKKKILQFFDMHQCRGSWEEVKK